MPSTRSLTLQIPTIATWGKQFRHNVNRFPRCTIAHLGAADDVFGELRNHALWTNAQMERMKVVEIYPGFGVWASTLLKGGFNSIYSLEPSSPYYKHMKTLAEQSNGAITLLKKDGYDWKTYVELKDNAYLGTLITRDWNKVNQDILFTGTIPKSSKGEQLLAQLMTCIINKTALHSMGRIPMALWMPDALYKKFIAPPGSKGRCKMSMVTEACAETSLIYSTEPSAMYPNDIYHLVHILPIPKSKIQAEWDVFEYVLRHIFVMRQKSLNKMVGTLGPGADIILDRLSFDSNIPINDMTVEQIDQVAIKFDQWPLRPSVLFEDSDEYI